MDSLVTRAVPTSARLYRVAWQPATQSAVVPEHEVFDVARLDRPDDMPGRVRALVTATLERVRDWVAGSQSRILVVRTNNATGERMPCNLEAEAFGDCTPKPDSIYTYSPLEQDSPFRDGWRVNHGFSANGGSDQVTYFLVIHGSPR